MCTGCCLVHVVVSFHLLVRSFVARSLARSFAGSFVRSLARSLVPSFLRSSGPSVPSFLRFLRFLRCVSFLSVSCAVMSRLLFERDRVTQKSNQRAPADVSEWQRPPHSGVCVRAPRETNGTQAATPIIFVCLLLLLSCFCSGLVFLSLSVCLFFFF